MFKRTMWKQVTAWLIPDCLRCTFCRRGVKHLPYSYRDLSLVGCSSCSCSIRLLQSLAADRFVHGGAAGWRWVHTPWEMFAIFATSEADGLLVEFTAHHGQPGFVKRRSGAPSQFHVVCMNWRQLFYRRLQGQFKMLLESSICLQLELSGHVQLGQSGYLFKFLIKLVNIEIRFLCEQVQHISTVTVWSNGISLENLYISCQQPVFSRHCHVTQRDNKIESVMFSKLSLMMMLLWKIPPYYDVAISWHHLPGWVTACC